MSEKISIAELRNAATRTTPQLMLTDQSRLLALVEAVEAAQRFAEHLLASDPRGQWHMSEFGLRDALARFDFSEPA